MSWPDLTAWWRDELKTDPAYEGVVTPLVVEMLGPQRSRRYLDLGCGEGRIMRRLNDLRALVHGLDISESLLSDIGLPVVVADVTALPVKEDTYSGVYAVLVLEHVKDHEAFFTEAARVTKRGGTLVLVSNHPVWTAPRSTPITDVDGEVLWRPGDYFSTGSSDVPAGGSSVVFHHRTMSTLLNAAASAGWVLERMVEQPHHEFEDQRGIPRLLACRWSLLP